MENENNNQNNHNQGYHSNICEVCGTNNGRCGRCGHRCGFGGYHILRWVLGIIIISWVFCIGVKFGEFKASVEGSGYGYGYNHMRISPMMGGATWSNADDTVYFTQSAPSTVSTGPVKVIKSN